MATTYSEFQGESASEKVGLVQLDAAERLQGWVLHAGAVYSLSKDVSVINSIEDSSVALVEVATLGAVSANEFFHDRVNKTIYLETSDSVDPNTKFIGMEFRLFFSNVGVKAPYDLASGKEVEWLPLLKSTSNFGVAIDNKDTQLGFALEGSGTISFFNDQCFWRSRYERLTFENKLASIYSWSRELPASQAKLLYRGRVQRKTYTEKQITFGLKDLLNELRAPVPMSDLQDFVYTHNVLGSISARVPTNLSDAKQRTVYGFLDGHVPANVDQSLTDTGYPVQGTVTATNGSKTITGAGSSWTKELFQGDKIKFANEEKDYTIASYNSSTSIEMSEDYIGLTGAGKIIAVFPRRGTEFLNRYHLIAGHELTKPSTTVVDVTTDRIFEVATAADFRAGDQVDINSEVRVIEAINNVNTIVLTQSLSAPPIVTDVISRLPVSAAFLDSDILAFGTDYDIEETTGLIRLVSTQTSHPELRIAAVQELSGTPSFTSGSQTVTGSGTSYKAELRPGDFLIVPSTGSKRQILSIDSDTSLFIHANADATEAIATTFQSPNYDVTLSLSVLGKSDTGLSTGALLFRAPEIVKDMLQDAGLTDILNSSSFDTANDLVQHRIGLAIPEKFDERKAPKIRDVINKINKSVFGSLFQNNNFKLEYSVLAPNKDLGTDRFGRADVLKFTVKSDISKIVKTTNISYGFKEFDREVLTKTNPIESFTSKIATHLSKVTRQFSLDTFLVDQSSARIFAGRWSFLLELARTVLSFNTKLQGADIEVNDKIEVNIPQLFQKIGSQIKRKTGLVRSVKRNFGVSQIQSDDLANAFSRASAITLNDALAFGSASDDQKMTNGYITDNNGLIDNSGETSGINLIW